MSLARALTKRYRTQEPAMSSLLGRAGSTRKYDRPIDRAQISLPIELLSTTNVHLYDAPDICDLNNSSASSTNSFEESDGFGALSSSSSVSSPEQSLRESSPISSVEPNHLSTYFQLPDYLGCPEDMSHLSSDIDVPAVPSRAPSHTTKSHQILARKRSQSQVRSTNSSITYSKSLPRLSLDTFSSKPDANHPFGAELAQVNELAEEFSTQHVTIWDEEEQFMVENGLQKFSAEDYIMEIQGLFDGVFDDRPYPMSTGWI